MLFAAVHWSLLMLWTGAPGDRRRVLIRLDRLNVVATPEQMNLPGFDFHALKGFVPTRYSVHVNGPWCITFEWEGENAFRVNLENYH